MIVTPLFVASLLALPPVMPPSAVQPGQKGTCLTVFQGSEVEPFNFTVRGVMENFLGPGKHVVLIRLEGEKPEFTGVVAGMSGSPCSIDGKLVGALAYAFAAFAKEPIAGITPMADMLEVMKLPSVERPWRLPAQKAVSNEDWDALREGRAARKPAVEGDLVPIAAPLSMSGVLPHVRRHFTPWLESEGFLPVAGGASGGSTEGTGATTLKPGDAVAAVLVKGDVNIAATGTVTSVEGNEVLAFGHPFLGTGILSVPMAAASIVNTMASQQRSFKMSNTGPILGEVTQDRLTAIGGYLGPAPAMIPVRGNYHTPAGTTEFQFDVARDPSLSPRFTAMGLANALYGGVDQEGRGTLRVNATVSADDLPPVKVQSVHASARDPNMQVFAAIDVARTLATLWDTPFGPPPGMKVEFQATLEAEPVVEWVEAMHLDRAIARPGEPINVAVRIRREDGPVRTESFSLQVPRTWAGREVDIIACGAELAQKLSEQLAGDPRPTDLDGVVRWLNEVRPDGNLYLMAVRDGAGMRSEVDTYSFLPPSVVTLMSGDVSKQRRLKGVAWEERRALPGTLAGGVKSTIKVKAY